MNLFNLDGKKAIVTGAAQGLGFGMAKGLMEAGAEVCILDISAHTQDTVDRMNAKGYSCHGITVDLSDREALKRSFDEAMDLLGGRLDILVTAAGVQKRHFCEDFPVEDWDWVMEINLHSVFLLCQLAGRQFMAQNSRGKIINISSLNAFFGGYTVPAYAASKGGISQLTKALSNEWSGKGINVNAIAPGYMATELNTALLADEKRSADILSRIPAGRWGTPDDLKGCAVFLASNASDYLGGAIIPVDGGYLVK